MAFVTVSFGTFAPLALSSASRRRAFIEGSPPSRAATVTSRMILVHSEPRLASCRFLRCWMLAHLEWPAMVPLSQGEDRGDAGAAGRRVYHRDTRTRLAVRAAEVR